MGQRVAWLYLVDVDRGDSGQRFLKSVIDRLGWIIQVVVRSQSTQGWVLVKTKSVVEQTFSLVNVVSRVEQG
ncbi:hypothetical protein QUA41_26035 [Microcoleus sp. Pol11C1]|uniref:hypothetical protein n=1 Tax=unclassified Microcoleus TaxID=2642155 RepID=UPI002FD363F4